MCFLGFKKKQQRFPAVRFSKSTLLSEFSEFHHSRYEGTGYTRNLRPDLRVRHQGMFTTTNKNKIVALYVKITYRV
jgi:uncharacterized protein YfiM (DUF2279 family)